MSDLISFNKPPDAKILAFSRTKEYPKPGSLVSINSKIVENYAKEIESKRDPDDRRDYGRIYAKLPTLDTTNQLFFYNTHIEVKYDISADILLTVSEVITTKKQGCRIKCHLRMINWPYDVEQDQKFIYLSDQDVCVVKPMVCNDSWRFSEIPPDNTKTFGIPVVKNNKKLWHVYDKEHDLPPPFVGIALEMGFKEFSWIAPVPVSADPVQKSPEPEPEIKKNVLSYEDDELDEEDFNAHPMSEFTMRLYEITCSSMASHGIITSPEFREELRQKYINLTNNADLRVDFYDDDEDQ